MRVHLIHPGELGPDEVAAWHALQQGKPSLVNPFLSPEYAIAVGRFRPDSRVAIITEGQRITGFFPFEERRFGLGVPISGWLSPCQGLIRAPGSEWGARELLRGCQLAAWKFDNLIFDQKSCTSFHVRTVPSPVIELTAGFEAYYAALRAKAPRFCRELERKTRKLSREVGELRAVSAAQDLSALRTLMAWKSSQYRRTNHFDRFQQPWIAGLLETILATQTDSLSGVLSVLYAGDQPVAAQFGLRASHLLVGWFTGYDARFSKYSPGLIQFMQITRELAANGVQEIHTGKGSVKYTQALKTSDIFVSEGIMVAGSVLGAAHRIRETAARWGRQNVREHQALHDAVDSMLRRSGVSARMYGKV
jgi:CelD/BcsL family acetyltransferase involved in cellulose biosynthesis